MKQIWFVLLVCVCVMPSLVIAQEVPTFRKSQLSPKGTTSVTLEFERIYQRDLDNATVSGTEFDDAGAVDDAIDAGTKARGVELESNAVFLRLAHVFYAPEDKPFGLEGYVLLGGADVELDGKVTSPGDPSEGFNVDGDFDFLFGGGVRARLYSNEKLTVLSDISLRYSVHESDIKKVNNLDLDLGAGESASQDFDTDLLAWQVSIYASYELEVANTSIFPYGGIRFSGVDVEVDGKQKKFDPDPDGSQDVKYDTNQSDVFGLFGGIEAGFSDKYSAFVELHVIDELSMTIGVSIRF